jgi:hypothetical protein
LLGEAREFAGTLAYGISGTELQGAYAITDHVAVMANTQAKWMNGATPTGNNFFGEAGIGYFLKLDQGRAEVFGGYGSGNSLGWNSAGFAEHGPRVKATFDRFFIQPSIGTNANRFNVIFTPRISLLNIKSMQAIEPDPNDPTIIPDDHKSDLGRRLFFEPSLTGRFPMGKVVYGFFQVGANIPFNLNSSYNYTYNGLHFALGVQIRTGRKLKDVD